MNKCASLFYSDLTIKRNSTLTLFRWMVKKASKDSTQYLISFEMLTKQQNINILMTGKANDSSPARKVVNRLDIIACSSLHNRCIGSSHNQGPVAVSVSTKCPELTKTLQPQLFQIKIIQNVASDRLRLILFS